MKINVEFTLPDNEVEYDNFKQSAEMHSVLWEFKMYLRNKVKYGDVSDAEYVVYNEVSEVFNEMLTDYGVKLD